MKGIILGFICSFVLLSFIPNVTVVSFVRKDHTPEKAFKLVRAEISAYTSSIGETDDNPFETASGSTVHVGTLACPSKYKFGTEVEIAGKLYICEDRMNKRYRDKENFDVWTESKKQAFSIGRQELAVKVYTNTVAYGVE